jgi:uncharacterized protein YjbI with pentapeptide repeats
VFFYSPLLGDGEPIWEYRLAPELCQLHRAARVSSTANDKHVALLKRSVAAWNAWRDENVYVRPDLSGADLSKVNLNESYLINANLSKADLNGANLSGASLLRVVLHGANLNKANLYKAALSGADLSKANLCGADLVAASLIEANLAGALLLGANLRRASLIEANLVGAYLSGADLGQANLSEASLRQAAMVDTNLNGADLAGCEIFGISAWNLKTKGTKQQNLKISRLGEPAITLDNIEVAQFIMLHNEKIREVIDTITSKVVLILGRFTQERKKVLDAIREELRRCDYLPILFDFDKPANRDITETISLLARMARFVIADITDAKAVPQELSVIVRDLPSVPVQSLLLKGSGEYGMFEHYAHYPWVLPLFQYETQDQLIAELGGQVIEPAERKALELCSGTRPIPPIT